MNGSDSDPKDSVTEVAEESFVRERPPDIERGTVLAGRYQIEDIIGKGGSGIVLRVFDRLAQNVVALKVLKTELARDAKWERRFSRELRLGRPIQHPNVCRIFDIGEADGHRFLTMELARGGSLRDELKRTRAADRPIADKLADVKAVISGLAALHAAGVVHRDFKPDNLLRMDDGRLVLSDFGLATDAANAPGATVLVGTPHYMAPEVLAGEPATSRSDVWALGVVLHEIFFGQRPERRSVSFDGSSRGPLRPVSVVERTMLALCERCLVDSPLDRPSDAGVVAQLLESARPSRSTKKGASRKKMLTYVAGVLLLSTLGATRLIRKRHSPSVASKKVPNVVRLSPEGTPRDLSLSATTLAEINGRVHCLAVVGETARIIWGTPRKAEEIDLKSGRRRPADLSAEAYRVGCPEVSPSGKALLSTAQTPAGVTEIRVAASREGRNGTTVTSGSDPTWLASDDEFVYDVDASHAAIFSRPTMTMALLSSPGFGDHHVVVDTAVNTSGNAIATLLGNDKSEFAVSVYDGQRFDAYRLFLVPPGTRIQFANDDELLLTAYRLPGIAQGMTTLNWKRGVFASSGFYPGFDILRAKIVGDTEVLVVRRLSSDAWLDDGVRHERLTSDGQDYSVAMSKSGDLLLSKRDADGNYNVWRQSPSGATKKLTSGKIDVGPEFGPDGKAWAYADYTAKSIVMCGGDAQSCRVLRRDEMLPIWPRFSPDGKLLAYVTQIGAPKLTVVSAQDGEAVKASWDAYYQCPPIWSSTSTVWDLEASNGRYSWYERNALTGVRTGGHVDAPNENIAVGEMTCWPKSLAKDSPLRPRAHIESNEISKVIKMSVRSGK